MTTVYRFAGHRYRIDATFASPESWRAFRVDDDGARCTEVRRGRCDVSGGRGVAGAWEAGRIFTQHSRIARDDDGYTIDLDGDGALDEAMAYLVADRANAEGSAVVHAAMIEVDGIAVLFAGRSGSGKSTVARSTTRARCANAVWVDATLLECSPLPFTGRDDVPPSRIEPLPLARMVVLERGSSPSFECFDRVRASMALMSQMVVVTGSPSNVRALDVAARIAASIPVDRCVCDAPPRADAILARAMRSDRLAP